MIVIDDLVYLSLVRASRSNYLSNVHLSIAWNKKQHQLVYIINTRCTLPQFGQLLMEDVQQQPCNQKQQSKQILVVVGFFIFEVFIRKCQKQLSPAPVSPSVELCSKLKLFVGTVILNEL